MTDSPATQDTKDGEGKRRQPNTLMSQDERCVWGGEEGGQAVRPHLVGPGDGRGGCMAREEGCPRQVHGPTTSHTHLTSHIHFEGSFRRYAYHDARFPSLPSHLCACLSMLMASALCSSVETGMRCGGNGKSRRRRRWPYDAQVSECAHSDFLHAMQTMITSLTRRARVSWYQVLPSKKKYTPCCPKALN